MNRPNVGQEYSLHNQPGSIVVVTRVWGEYNEVHQRTTEYVQYDIEHIDGRAHSRDCYSTLDNWHLGEHNRELVGSRCLGIEIAPGKWSGCDAHGRAFLAHFNSQLTADLLALRETVRVLGEENERWKEINRDELAETFKLIEALGVADEVKAGRPCMDAMLSKIAVQKDVLAAVLKACDAVNDRYVGGSPLRGKLGDTIENLAKAAASARFVMFGATNANPGARAAVEKP